MVLVVVSSFKPVQNLEEICKGSNVEYVYIDTEQENSDDIQKLLLHYFSVPGKVVENLFSTGNKLIYVRNDGTFDDNDLATLISEYLDTIQILVEKSDVEDFIKFPVIKVLSIRTKLKLLSLVNLIKSNKLDLFELSETTKDKEKVLITRKPEKVYVDNIDEDNEEDDNEDEVSVSKKPRKVVVDNIYEDDEEYDNEDEVEENDEEESELDNVIKKHKNGDFLEAEIEELESNEENIKYFTIQLVDMKGNKRNGKVRLDIDSDDGVFVNGTTSTIINVDKNKENRFKVIVANDDADVEFSYEILD